MTVTASGVRAGVLAAVAVALGVGAFIAIQGQVNADLAEAGPGVLWASWSSYLGTLVSVVAVIVARRRVRRTAAVLRDRAQWWWFALGLCSVPIVYAMTFGVPILGVALASVCSVAGQTVSGMLLDARGVGIPAPIRITGRRVTAGICALAGLTVAMLLGPGGVSGTGIVAGVAALALFMGGFMLSGQQSGNGRVTHVAGDPVVAALTCVTGGTLATTAVVAVVAVVAARSGLDAGWPGLGDWALYLGGPLGAAVTVAAAWAVRHLGSFALTLGIVGGQLVAAVALDLVFDVGLHWATGVAMAAIGTATYLAMDRRSAGS